MSDYVQLAKKLVDAYNNKDVNTFIDMYAEGANVVFPDLATPTIDEMREEFHEILEIFPDRHFEVTRIVATDKGAVVECLFKGKNLGSFLGNPPSNRDVENPIVHIYDFEDDKVVRQRTYANYMILMQQLSRE
jgi:steroid delta-isomerase-like uncharacterized protein